MANPTVGDSVDKVSRATTVVRSATVLVNSIGSLVQAGINEAMTNGATAEELAPLQLVADDLNSQAAELATAVAAHTVAENEPVA